MKQGAPSRFVSASASGADWRDASRKVLDALALKTPDGFQGTIGFLYITDLLTADAASILTLMRTVTGVQHWTGCAALGVCGDGIEYLDRPAISVMIGEIGAEDVHPIETRPKNTEDMKKSLEPWLNTRDPMLVVAHADPFLETDPAGALEEIDTLVGGFIVGGLASGRGENVIFGTDAMEGGVSGFVFSADVAVATALSQGCVPMGGLHEISRADEFVIGYLDGKKPLDVFTSDLKAMTERKLGHNPDDIMLEQGLSPDMDMPPNLRDLFRGDAHIAFPVAGSDINDFLVRNIMAIDPENGMMAVSERIEDGQQVMFVHRDDETVRADLSATLVALRGRVTAEQGEFAPRAALYISCVARAGVAFTPGGGAGGEMALLKEILGDIPITGFYANGEISNTRLYGYTGVLTLFL